MFLADVVNATIPPSPTPGTSPLSLSWLPDSLKTTDSLFIIASCWAGGYLARKLPIVILRFWPFLAVPMAPQYRPLAVTVCGMAMSIALVHPLVRAIGLGMINICLSMVTYDQVFSRIEDAFANFRLAKSASNSQPANTP